MEIPVCSVKITCDRCSQEIKTREYLKCRRCLRYYDLLCTNVSEKRFYNTMREEHKSNWKCEKCVDTPSTPDSGAVDSGLSNITFRTRRENDTSSTSRTPPGATLNIATATDESIVTELHMLRDDIISAVREEMQEFQRSVRAEMQEFRRSITGLTSAVGACNSRIDELNKRVEFLENSRFNQEPADGNVLNKAIAGLKLELNERDQDLLCNDLEIAGIPEERNENPTHLTLAVATKLGVKLEERDIVSAERVGGITKRRAEHDRSESLRPAPIVVRMARRAQREEFLSAARVRRNTTTAGLGLASTERRLYINERLTRLNRHIFYKARTESQRANFKYVWTRDGKIFTRKEHGAERHRLRSEDDIARFFGLG